MPRCVHSQEPHRPVSLCNSSRRTHSLPCHVPRMPQPVPGGSPFHVVRQKTPLARDTKAWRSCRSIALPPRPALQTSRMPAEDRACRQPILPDAGHGRKRRTAIDGPPPPHAAFLCTALGGRPPARNHLALFLTFRAWQKHAMSPLPSGCTADCVAVVRCQCLAGPSWFAR